MSNQANFQSATMELLKHLKSKKETMQARHAAELSEIDKEIEAVSITVRLLREAASASENPVEEIRPTIVPANLDGMSTREACIEIARLNQGFVRIGDAKKALVSAGILKESKNTWSIIYTTLQRSKEFEKAQASGAFKLLTYPTAEAAQASLLQ